MDELSKLKSLENKAKKMIKRKANPKNIKKLLASPISKIKKVTKSITKTVTKKVSKNLGNIIVYLIGIIIPIGILLLDIFSSSSINIYSYALYGTIATLSTLFVCSSINGVCPGPDTPSCRYDNTAIGLAFSVGAGLSILLYLYKLIRNLL